MFQISENVEVRFINDAKGRGLFSKRNFKKGDVIFVEKPLASCQFSWNKKYLYKACSHCLRPLETAQENARRLTGRDALELFYPECCDTNINIITECNKCGEKYCSEECLTLAYNLYHRTLCPGCDASHPLLKLEEAWQDMHFPPETSAIMILPRILAMIAQSSNKDEMRATFLQMCHSSVNKQYELAHKFMGKNFEGQVNILYDLARQAVNPEAAEEIPTLTTFQNYIAMLGTNGQGVGTSSFSKWVENASKLPLSDSERKELNELIDKLYADMDEHVGINFLNNEGVALYSMQSLCNHNCTPNAETSFLYNNYQLSLVALRDIEVGDEICISYIDACNLRRSRHSRAKHLAEHYLFLCSCRKCEEQAADPDVTSEEEYSDEEMSE